MAKGNDNAKKCCATCIKWGGYDPDDVAGCQAPVPIWASILMEAGNLDEDNSICGDRGQGCPCYEPGGIEEIKGLEPPATGSGLLATTAPEVPA